MYRDSATPLLPAAEVASKKLSFLCCHRVLSRYRVHSDFPGGVDPGADAPVSRHQGLHPHPDHLQEDLHSFLRGRQE
jgi:hypothetical protein